MRHWQATGADSSRRTAYQLLRGLTYLQTVEGTNAGNVVLWMQPDGTLNPSAEPVELPDPSDSAESYWLARTIWALGEALPGVPRGRPGVRRLPRVIASTSRSARSSGRCSIATASGSTSTVWPYPLGSSSMAPTQQVRRCSGWLPTWRQPPTHRAGASCDQLGEGVAAM